MIQHFWGEALISVLRRGESNQRNNGRAIYFGIGPAVFLKKRKCFIKMGRVFVEKRLAGG